MGKEDCQDSLHGFQSFPATSQCQEEREPWGAGTARTEASPRHFVLGSGTSDEGPASILHGSGHNSFTPDHKHVNTAVALLEVSSKCGWASPQTVGRPRADRPGGVILLVLSRPPLCRGAHHPDASITDARAPVISDDGWTGEQLQVSA